MKAEYIVNWDKELSSISFMICWKRKLHHPLYIEYVSIMIKDWQIVPTKSAFCNRDSSSSLVPRLSSTPIHLRRERFGKSAGIKTYFCIIGEIFSWNCQISHLFSQLLILLKEKCCIHKRVNLSRDIKLLVQVGFSDNVASFFSKQGCISVCALLTNATWLILWFLLVIDPCVLVSCR